MEKLWSNRTFQVIVSFCAFFALSVPFRYFFSIAEGLTDVRPAVALQVFLGMTFGVTGGLGCSLANFVADIMFDTPLTLSLLSFPIQMLSSCIPYWLWYNFPLKDEQTVSLPRMDTAKHLLKFVVILLSNALITTGLLCLLLFMFDVQNLAGIIFVMFFNNIDFSILICMILFTLIAWKSQKNFSLNEYLILCFLGIAVTASILTGLSVWLLELQFVDDIYHIWVHMQASVAITLNIFMIGGIFAITHIERHFTIPVQNLAAAADQYAGNKGTSGHERFIAVCNAYRNSKIEVGNLARAYSDMMTSLLHYTENLKHVTAEKERIATELNVATNIQLSALPHDFLENHSEFEVYATMKAAKAVGGDFYDFYLVDEKHLVITIADVSGKSVGAALFMMRGKTILKNLTMMMNTPDDLSAVMTLANRQLCQENDEMMFITVFLAMLDLNSGKLIYVNGGHNPPLLYRQAEDNFRYLSVKKNRALGVVEDMNYAQQETQMNPGEILYLYTDGVTEAMSENNELYGEKRLEECLNHLDRQCKLSILLEGVSKSLAAHVQEAEQSDDITMLALRFKGN